MTISSACKFGNGNFSFILQSLYMVAGRIQSLDGQTVKKVICDRKLFWIPLRTCKGRFLQLLRTCLYKIWNAALPPLCILATGDRSSMPFLLISILFFMFFSLCIYWNTLIWREAEKVMKNKNKLKYFCVKPRKYSVFGNKLF